MFTKLDHTFVVCAYGDSHYLSDCLASLQLQTEKTNVIIATSTPSQYIDAIARAADIQVCVNDESGGIASDWNYALSCADTRLVTIAHQDDVYDERYVEHMLEQVNNISKPLIYFTNYGEIRDNTYLNNSPISAVKCLLLKPLALGEGASTLMKRSSIAFGNAICCPSVTYNLECIHQPVFKAGMRSNLDWEAWEKLSTIEGSFVYDERIGMYHRVHEGSETSACIADNVRIQEDLAMLEKFWPKPIARFINKMYKFAQTLNG